MVYKVVHATVDEPVNIIQDAKARTMQKGNSYTTKKSLSSVLVHFDWKFPLQTTVVVDVLLVPTVFTLNILQLN